MAGNCGGQKIQFDQRTGKLLVVKTNERATFSDDDSSGHVSDVSSSAGREKLSISVDGEERVTVRTMHLSCKSDTYQSDRNYGGVIIYLYDGMSDWITANNTDCKSGYIVIQDTDSENIQRWMSTEPGIVHGAVYRNAFGESVKDAEVVCEGFSVRNGMFEISSGVFNNPPGSLFHDDFKIMHELSKHCVGKIVEYWKEMGSCLRPSQTFEVKELLMDYT